MNVMIDWDKCTKTEWQTDWVEERDDGLWQVYWDGVDEHDGLWQVELMNMMMDCDRCTTLWAHRGQVTSHQYLWAVSCPPAWFHRSAPTPAQGWPCPPAPCRTHSTGSHGLWGMQTKRKTKKGQFLSCLQHFQCVMNCWALLVADI